LNGLLGVGVAIDSGSPPSHPPPGVRLYDLRHTCATLLLQAGENPKVVSERLGHSTITLTLDVYSHVLPDVQKAATEKLENLLFRKAGTP
jgi:integrase